MSAKLIIAHHELIEIASPYPEPRIAYQDTEPRKASNLTLIDGKTFLSTNPSGDIMPPGAPDVGFFHDDTRFLSRLELRINGHPTGLLSSSTEQTFLSQIELTTGRSTLRDTYEIPENTIHIRREQLLCSGIFYDYLTFENFNFHELELIIELEYEADYVDVFQVRGVARERMGQYYKPLSHRDSLIFYYRGLDDLVRETAIHFSPHPEQVEVATARWKMKLPPFKRFQLQTTITPFVANERVRSLRADFGHSLRSRREAISKWEAYSTQFESSNRIFDQLLKACVGDFHALQIPDGKEHIIGAGIPWFATMFGRDSIIAAFQSLLLNPQLASETLRVLARYQGKEENDWRDEQPGKILHEFREGEMTNAGEMPFSPYYGSVDATPLWLVLLSETFNWTADEQLVKDMLPHARRALQWIDQYGDLDGDGFVEYLRRSPKGLTNQGWKDSWDANVHGDGEVAKPPLALCEVQGYVYEAKYRMASLLRSFGDTATADKLKKDAAELAKRFEKAYWMPQKGFYAMALDREKRQLQVISSNPGHLLFTRMLPLERARAVTQRLIQPDMFSGWGLRTMSRDERPFNPLSYHRGSVWPHDNSIAAHGMALYEFREASLQVFTGLFQAALNFRDYRLPELFCGIQRGEHDRPVQYPVSCWPQAWASGAVFLLLTSVLGIRPSAQRKEINVVNPTLPWWLDYLHIRNLRIGKSRVGLDFTRHGDRTFCNVVDIEGEKLLVNIAFKKR
ncbi:MAG TPA: glycogen debranching N-terminal domain-containing protein [Candidatus Angelobacter sp.]|jgi:glycogen debranching enzyme|nr:glycogen debranching N-terminal domain-containing protein [Candidatus Angelobacter sp.]